MRQAITTKYLGPTNHRGARVKATAQVGSVTVPWDDALDVDENHRKAATLLAMKYQWTEHSSYSRLEGGWTHDSLGVWVVCYRQPLKSTLGLGTKEYWENRLAEGDVSSKCLDDDDDRAAVAEVVASIFENGL